MKRSLLFLIMLSVVRPCFSQGALGPFGFEKGMSREQVIKLVGQAAVRDRQRSEPDTLIVTTAPKPKTGLDGYILVFSPTVGLLKIIGFQSVGGASGIALDAKLLEMFQQNVSALTRQYGKPAGIGPPSGPGSMAAVWSVRPPVNNVARAQVEIRALNYHQEHPDSIEGYLNIGYEFVGWSEYAAKRTAAQ